MHLETIPFNEYLEIIPNFGRHIIGQQTENQILVYQAFNNLIADYAIENQSFGGQDYSYSRMSWIKPNFLWMMYRCGWAEKVNQERVLGIWINKTDFDLILSNCAFSSYKSDIHKSHDEWKKTLLEFSGRLQWDPDHNIFGEKQERKAIQLGIKGNLLEIFGNEMINEIIDLTEFVKEQKLKINNNKIDELILPKEIIYKPKNSELLQKIGLESTAPNNVYNS